MQGASIGNWGCKHGCAESRIHREVASTLPEKRSSTGDGSASIFQLVRKGDWKSAVASLPFCLECLRKDTTSPVWTLTLRLQLSCRAFASLKAISTRLSCYRISMSSWLVLLLNTLVWLAATVRRRIQTQTLRR